MILDIMTPTDVHHGRAPAVHDARARVLAAAYAKAPQRFVRRAPTPPPLPTAAWINKPAERSLINEPEVCQTP